MTTISYGVTRLKIILSLTFAYFENSLNKRDVNNNN